MKRADVSIDGAPWHTVVPEDGIADSPRETYVLDLLYEAKRSTQSPCAVLTVSGNVGSARITVRR